MRDRPARKFRAFVIAGGHRPEVLEAAIGAFDDVAPLVALRIEGKAALAMGLVGNDGNGASAVQKAAEVVGIVAFVANQPSRRRGHRQQRHRDGDIGDIAAGQQKGTRAACRVDERVDFRGAPAARAADRLGLLPPFAPLAERCALTAVLSIITTAGASAQATSAAKRPCQMPRLLHRLYRLNTVVYGPYSAGRARQRQPSRRRCRMPLMMRRSSCRTGPVCTIGNSGAITAHCRSLSQKWSATIQIPPDSLDHDSLLEYRP